MGAFTAMNWCQFNNTAFRLYHWAPGALLVLVFLLLWGCVSNPAKDQWVVGPVTKVHDGDSIHITPRGSKRVVIRLAGIDAPEIDQEFGLQSRDKLRSLIMNKSARAQCHKQDKYQRRVCVVRYADKDINLQMVAEGMAWHYKQYQNEQSARERRSYAAAEANAQKRQLGLWAVPAVAPWDYRQAL